MRLGLTMVWSAAGFVGGVALLLSAGGCVERRLVVESDPPGALVWLNDQEVGRTPLEREFVWYGTYDVRLRKEGYQTVRTRSKVWAPWWQIPPLDLIAELVPARLQDRKRLSYTLEPAEPVDTGEFIARAVEMRGRLESSEVQPPEDDPALIEESGAQPGADGETTATDEPVEPDDAPSGP